jgi:hypothetical protein
MHKNFRQAALAELPQHDLRFPASSGKFVAWLLKPRMSADYRLKYF